MPKQKMDQKTNKEADEKADKQADKQADQELDLDDYDFKLPKDRIAHKAASPRDSSKLMVVRKNACFGAGQDIEGQSMDNQADLSIEHRHFYTIAEYLKRGDVLVVNETKVRRSKIIGKKMIGKAHKTQGSAVEMILIEKKSESEYGARIRGRGVRIGNRYCFKGCLYAQLVGRQKDLFMVRFDRQLTPQDFEDFFILPTPPYIDRIPTEEEYQTVYSDDDKKRSFAAPTAGLHFTDELLEKLESQGVIIAKICLHVDFGTFLPIKGPVPEHTMHTEEFEISKDAAQKINERRGRLICVGTTSVRTLESAADKKGRIIPQCSTTDIFIYPPYSWKCSIDCLITNFHFPKSTLLLLVSAYFGREEILYAYQQAIEQDYRFFSLGDSMMLIR